jgi:hypothetical protein
MIIRFLFNALNFMLLSGRPNFAEISRTTWTAWKAWSKKKENIVKLVLNGTLVDGILCLAENVHVSEKFNYTTLNKWNMPATKKTVTL